MGIFASIGLILFLIYGPRLIQDWRDDCYSIKQMRDKGEKTYYSRTGLRRTDNDQRCCNRNGDPI